MQVPWPKIWLWRFRTFISAILTIPPYTVQVFFRYVEIILRWVLPIFKLLFYDKVEIRKSNLSLIFVQLWNYQEI